jgi:small subunit ribosomal protein S18
MAAEYSKKPRGERGNRDRDRERDDDGGRDGGGFGRRRQRPPLDMIFDYKDPETLKPFVGEGGRIVPARVSRLSRGQQLRLAIEIKRARQLALLPIADSHRP